MKITNKLGLPQPIVDAVKNDDYDGGSSDISVTTLLKPARQVALQKGFWDEIEEDVADRMWALQGQLVHSLLERAGTDGLNEHRLFIEIGDWKVSGQIDRYFDGVLQDWKYVTAWKVKGGVPKEYEEQTNCYAELLRRNGHIVKKIELVAILRDWSKMEAARDQNYPQLGVVTLDVPVWEPERVSSFLMRKVKEHRETKFKLPECSPEERWEKPTVFAVKKKDVDRAMRLYATRTESEAHVGDSTNLVIEERIGSSPRCEFYCNVSRFCSQFRKMKEGK